MKKKLVVGIRFLATIAAIELIQLAVKMVNQCFLREDHR
jgi:hypothetical protein